MRKFTLVLALILLIGMQGVFAQLRVITGVVTSSDDKAPIPGVTIVVKSTTIGTTTNLDGKYTLAVPAKYDALEFSYVGMKTQLIKLGQSITLDVVMQPDVMNMDEVVVTAIGIPRETKALSLCRVAPQDECRQWRLFHFFWGRSLRAVDSGLC